MKLLRLAVRAAMVAAALLAGAGLAAPDGQATEMKFFRIVSGSAGGTYFPMASLLAQVISSPPGAAPCERGGSCGVAGMIATVSGVPAAVRDRARATGCADAGPATPNGDPEAAVRNSARC